MPSDKWLQIVDSFQILPKDNTMCLLSSLIMTPVLATMSIGFIGDDKPQEWEIKLDLSTEFLDESELTFKLPVDEPFPELKKEKDVDAPKTQEIIIYRK